jgi:hypothetical protein
VSRPAGRDGWQTPGYCSASRLLAALAFAVFLIAGLAACGPANGSPNCPPGQWYVETPGAGWSCMSDPGPPPSVFTPAPASPAGSAP